MPPTTGMVLWLKPETLGAAASNLASWPDSSGNGYDLAQATEALQPIVSADTIPGAIFDGSKQLLGPATAALNFPNGYTLFVVMKEEAIPISGHLNYEIIGKLEASVASPGDFDGWLFGRRSLYSPTITSSNTYHDFEFYNSDFEVEAFFANDIDGFAWTGDYNTSLHIYTAQMFPEATMQGMRMLTRRDGRSLDAEWAGLDELGTNIGGAAPMPSPTQAGFLFLGLASPTPWWGPTVGFNGTIYEVLIYEGQLSAGDVAVTEAYLNEKYSTTPPNRTYFAPTEVAQAEYNDTWIGLDVPTGTLAGDTVVIQVRFFPSTDSDFTIFIGATPFAWRYTGINAAVASTLFPGSVVRLRIYARVTQGLDETFYITADSGVKTSPVRPFMVHMTTYQGLSASADSAPFEGNDSPPYGYIQQDVTYNFSIENVDDRAPNYQDHIADENWAAHPNSMRYLASVADVDSPAITSTVLAEGGTGPLTDTGGDIWMLFGLVFEADSEPVAVSYNCTEGGCTDPGDGSGEFATLEECEAVCVAPVSYNCVDGVCIDPGDGLGEFATLLECQLSGCEGPFVSTTVTTERFDSGEGSEWWIVPAITDSGNELQSKVIKPARVTGRLTNASLMIYTWDVGGEIDVAELEAGTGSATGPIPLDDTTQVTQSPLISVDCKNAVLSTIRVEGDDTGQAVRDQVHEILYQQATQGVRR